MDQKENNISVTVIWRGKKFIVEINSSGILKELGDELLKLTNVKADSMRLIIPQSSGRSLKLLGPFSDEHSYLKLQDTSILGGKPIRMLGVSENEVEEVLKGAKANLRIAGFEEEEKRMRMRMLNRPQALLKLPQGPYIFCEFRTLELPRIELNPPASEALKMMHMLAADPGIVAIMNKHRGRVGIMTEMAPVGYVGISPKCILGSNKNHAEEISLCLCTDDLKDFWKYESIKKTLLHELAHMIHSEHDANFYASNKQLNEEASSLDWTQSRSYTLGAIRSEQSNVDGNFEPESTSSHTLGGKTSLMPHSAHAASVTDAHQCLADSLAGSVVLRGDEEPDPDAPISGIRVEGEMIIQNGSQEQLKPDCEPDPDDSLGNQIKLEPDPDDLQATEDMESESYVHDNRIKAEPDPDDTGMTERMQNFTTNGLLDNKEIHEEPDPDDSEVPCNSGAGNEHHQVESQLAQTKTNSGSLIKSSDEPDPDNFEVKTSNLGNGDFQDKEDKSTIDRMADQKNQNICVVMASDVSGENKIVQAVTASVTDAHQCLADSLAGSVVLRGDEEPDPDAPISGIRVEGEMIIQNGSQEQLKPDCEPDPDDSLGNQIKLEPDPDDLQATEDMESESYVHDNRIKAEPDPDDTGMTERMQNFTTNGLLDNKEIHEEPDPDDSEVPCNSGAGNEHHQVESQLAQTKTNSGSLIKSSDEPDPDNFEVKTSNLGNGDFQDKEDKSTIDRMADQKNQNICVVMASDVSGENKIVQAVTASVTDAHQCLADSLAGSVVLRGDEEPDPDAPISGIRVEGEMIIQNGSQEQLKPDCEPDPDDSLGNQIKLEPDPDDLQATEDMESESYVHDNRIKAEPDPDDTGMTERMQNFTTNGLLDNKEIHEEPDPDDSEVPCNSGAGNEHHQVESQLAQTKTNSGSLIKSSDEPDPDNFEVKTSNLGNGDFQDKEDKSTIDRMADQKNQNICVVMASDVSGENKIVQAVTASVTDAHQCLADSLAGSVVLRGDEEPDPDAPISGIRVEGEMIIQNGSQEQLKPDCEPDPDDSLGNQIKLEPDPDDLQATEDMESESYVHDNRIKAEPDPDDTGMTERMQNFTTNGLLDNKEIHEEPDPDDSEVPCNSGAGNEHHQVESQLAQTKTNSGSLIKSSDEPDPDNFEVKTSNLGNGDFQDKEDKSTIDRMADQKNQNICVVMASDVSGENKIVQAEPDPDDELDNLLVLARTENSEPDPDDLELQRIQDPVITFHSHLTKATEMLQAAELGPKEAGIVLQTLFRIIRNVVEHPDELKYKRFCKENPVFQRNVACFKAALEVLFMIGSSQDVSSDGIGMSETYVVLKGNDPGLLWLAKSFQETCVAW